MLGRTPDDEIKGFVEQVHAIARRELQGAWMRYMASLRVILEKNQTLRTDVSVLCGMPLFEAWSREAREMLAEVTGYERLAKRAIKSGPAAVQRFHENVGAKVPAPLRKQFEELSTLFRLGEER